VGANTPKVDAQQSNAAPISSIFGAPIAGLLGGGVGMDDETYNQYLRDLLIRLETERNAAKEKELTRGTPERAVLGPNGTGVTSDLLPVGTDSPEGEMLRKMDATYYQQVNKVMPKWFTEFDNKVRKADVKLQKIDGRKITNKAINKLTKGINKKRKKLHKKLGF
jgi:hypothetical protein